MKNLLIIMIIASFISEQALGQTVKGKKYVGGTFSLSATHSNSKNSDFNINPSVGVFLTDHLSIGGIIGYHNTIYKDDNSKSTMNGFSIGAFCRQHIPLSDLFSVYIQEDISFSNQINQYENNDTQQSKYSTSGISFSAGPGLIFFPTPKFGFEVGIGSVNYGHQSEKNKLSDSDPVTTNSYGLKVDLTTLNLGLRYYF
jgi:hypothetical protein